MATERNLFDVTADGDDQTLRKILAEGREERNVATLAVRSPI